MHSISCVIHFKFPFSVYILFLHYFEGNIKSHQHGAEWIMAIFSVL